MWRRPDGSIHYTLWGRFTVRGGGEEGEIRRERRDGDREGERERHGERGRSGERGRGRYREWERDTESGVH